MQITVLGHYILYNVTKCEEELPCQIVDLHVSIVGLEDDVAGALTRIVSIGPFQHAASLKCIERYVPITRCDPSCLLDNGYISIGMFEKVGNIWNNFSRHFINGVIDATKTQHKYNK